MEIGVTTLPEWGGRTKAAAEWTCEPLQLLPKSPQSGDEYSYCGTTVTNDMIGAILETPE